MTLQTDTSEQGQTAPDGSDGVTYPTTAFNPNQAITTGSNKGSAPTLGSLGWTSAANVAIGVIFDNIGNTGITLQSMTLNLYSGTTLEGSFSIAHPINYTAADLALQPGNGNAVFTFVPDAAQQTAWALLNPTSSWAIGLAASAGCAGTSSATCQVSNDGPDSFIAISQPRSPSLVPLPGALPLFASGLAGLGLLGWRRKRKALAA